MKITKLPSKYLLLWKKALPLLKRGRAGDAKHAAETVAFILNYKGKIKMDHDVFIPVAMLHDIGHIAVLPESFKHLTGPEKLINGKLVHILTGAKIARDILTALHYPKRKMDEIVDIIGSHDADQLRGIDLKRWYNTKNKKIFHDVDSLDRYTKTRITSFKKFYPKQKELLKMLDGLLKNFFYEEFKNMARKRFQSLV